MLRGLTSRIISGTAFGPDFFVYFLTANQKEATFISSATCLAISHSLLVKLTSFLPFPSSSRFLTSLGKLYLLSFTYPSSLSGWRLCDWQETETWLPLRQGFVSACCTSFVSNSFVTPVCIFHFLTRFLFRWWTSTVRIVRVMKNIMFTTVMFTAKNFCEHQSTYTQQRRGVYGVIESVTKHGAQLNFPVQLFYYKPDCYKVPLLYKASQNDCRLLQQNIGFFKRFNKSLIRFVTHARARRSAISVAARRPKFNVRIQIICTRIQKL